MTVKYYDESIDSKVRLESYQDIASNFLEREMSINFDAMCEILDEIEDNAYRQYYYDQIGHRINEFEGDE